MENFEDSFGMFWNYQKILEYFNEFYHSLKNVDWYVSFPDNTKIFKCLNFLTEHHFLQNDIESKNDNELGQLLLKILNTFCSDDFFANHKCENIENASNERFMYECCISLIHILTPKFKKEIYVKNLLCCIKNSFNEFSQHQEKFSNNETEEQFLKCLLKLLVIILKFLGPTCTSNEFTDDFLIIVLKEFPFSDKYALNIFSNQIIPSLESNYNLKKQILELIWTKITDNFEESCYTHEESYYMPLLCCFCDNIFKEKCDVKNFGIYDDTIWKIVQNTLTNQNSFIRRQAIYVFKTILFWLKSKNCLSPTPSSEKKVPLFAFTEIKDMLIWNDLVTLFETLEEKQIHVIKPVLPKFTRILQQSNAWSSNSLIFHPSWIICFIKRMIFHESKFIMREALTIAMSINFKQSRIHQLQPEEFIQVVIDGFNDQHMYSRVNENDGFSLFLTSEKIAIFLENYIAAFKTDSQKISFLRNLLKIIASKSWSGVALLHVTFALTALKSHPSWKNKDMVFVREIIQGTLKTHEYIIRKAVEHWLLKSCILFMDWNSLSFEDLADFLLIFETVERHTTMWNAVVSKLKEMLSSEFSDNLSASKAQEFALGCINKIQANSTGEQEYSDTALQKIAKLLILFADSSIISSNFKESGLNWLHLLQPLTSVLLEAPKRPYLCEQKFYRVLQFYTHLIDMSRGSGSDANDAHSAAIISCLNCSFEFLDFIYRKSLMEIRESSNITKFKLLFNALCAISSVDRYRDLFLKLLPGFLMNYDAIPHVLPKQIMIILFYEISNTDCTVRYLILMKELNYSLLSKILNSHVITDLTKTVFLNDVDKEVWQKITEQSINKFWVTAYSTVNFLLAYDNDGLMPKLLQLADQMLDFGPKSTFASTITCVESQIQNLGLSDGQIIKKLLDSAQKACLELRGCEAFRTAINSFIKAVFQPFLMIDDYFDILYEYSEYFRVLSENSVGVFYLVIQRFTNVFSLKKLHKASFDYIPILIHSLTYGPIHQKGQKILEDSIMYISQQDEHFSKDLKNYKKPSAFVRVVAITYLINSLYDNSPKSEKIALRLMNALFELDNTTRLLKTNKFPNSLAHRVRNRIWQTILLLLPNLMTEESNKKLLIKVSESLEADNQQPSIRYLQEWLVLKILHKYDCYIEDFISVLKKSEENIPSCSVSLLSIMIHLIAHDDFSLSEKQVQRCFPILINFCMAQNFAVRLYSRLCLDKLFLYCEENGFSKLTVKYDFLCDILCQERDSDLLEKGNIFKNLLKLEKDFYFSVFHPIDHFTLETIFFELPRLSNLPSEEWLKAEYFQEKIQAKSELIACFNKDDDLKNSFITEKSEDETPVSECDIFDYNFQRKICPVRSETSNFTTDIVIESKPKKNGLIVIASLIDKIPNLGGLCRTCEVFGVSQFVIGSLKYKDDKAFQTLAVSSEKWVVIKEVKPYHLKEYLLSLKEEGYTLVGAEQTDDSCTLSSYVFPEKTALLLGHEREGMPVDLIQILDVCVEIPQQGIVRSLNVHVSGAIFIWEYARQQIKV